MPGSAISAAAIVVADTVVTIPLHRRPKTIPVADEGTRITKKFLIFDSAIYFLGLFVTFIDNFCVCLFFCIGRGEGDGQCSSRNSGHHPTSASSQTALHRRRPNRHGGTLCAPFTATATSSHTSTYPLLLLLLLLLLPSTIGHSRSFSCHSCQQQQRT